MSITDEKLHKIYIFLLIFMSAMLGVVLSDNMLSMYMFWEMTSVSSFLLISYWHENDASRKGALKSLIITVFGGVLMLAGIFVLNNITGSFNVSEIIEFTKNHGYNNKHSFHSIFGYLMRWLHLHQSVVTFTQLQWLKPESIYY